MQTDRQELLTLALDIGRGLLENGAETYRVEESVNRILTAYGIPKAEVFAIPTCIITSISDGGDTSTRVERIFHRGTNLDRVMKLNSLSRWICSDLPSVEEIRERLSVVLKERSYSLPVKVIGFSLVAAAFTLFLGGGLMDALVAALCGFVTKPVIELLERYQMNIFFADIIGGALIAGVALLAAGLGLTSQVDLVIIGALMNLVPGVAITNSMRDIIAGDLVAGLAKLLRFFVATVAITVYAEVMARLCKTPVTAYLVVSLLPLVPGGGIYYTMRYFINGETQLFIETGLNTLAIAGALAVGILPVFSLVRLYRRIRSQHRGKNKLDR